MTKFKSYQKFINESKNNYLINIILDAIEPNIVELVNKTEAYFLEKLDKRFSDYDREMTRLNIIFDMVKSIEKYTLPTDSLVSINTSVSRKGNLEISAKIQRENVVYDLSTEVIIAGGYNIQIAHYRYITSTDLPTTGQSVVAKEYSDKIKKMTKIEKLNNEIESFQKRIEQNNKRVETASKLTDEEIFKITQHDGYVWPTWKEIVRRGAAKNYNNNEAEYNMKMKEDRVRSIESYKNLNIKGPSKNTEALKKEIIKLEAKIKQAIDNI
jgi:hypothetical protein